jgi:3-oxoadipate enol-lactonase
MFRSEFITAGNLTLYVRREGAETGTPLVFMNSLGTDHRIWDAVIPVLAADTPIVRYDKRGHGLSDCPPAPYSIRDHTYDLAGLLAALNINQAIVVGISVGGMIAMDFAAANPGQVTALVLCDTYPKIGTAEMWNDRINTLRARGMAALSSAILARWFAPNFQIQYPAVYRGYENMLLRTPVEGYTGTCEAIRDADLTGIIPTIQTPTLVLCGTMDVSTPPVMVRELANMMPNARYVEIADAGHLSCIESPAAVTAAIHTFLKDMR